MILTDEKSIDAAIKAGEGLSPALIWGEEEYLKQQVLHRLADRPGDAFASFNDSRFDFASLDWPALFDAVLTMPLMAERKTVLVYDVVPKELNAEGFKRFEELFGAAAGGDCLLVLLEKSGAVDEKKDDKSKKLIKLADKYGCVFHLKERTEALLQRMVKSDAAKAGCAISPAAQKLLVAYCGKDTAALKNEVDKLCALKGYRKDHEITEADVANLTTPRPEDNIYGLSKAVLRGDYDGAMRILRGLIALRYPAESVMGTLAGYYADLYRAKAALSCGKSAADVAADFGYGKRAFLVEGAMRDARRMGEEELLRALDVLAAADLQLKSTQGDEQTVLEAAVTELFLCVPARAAG